MSEHTWESILADSELGKQAQEAAKWMAAPLGDDVQLYYCGTEEQAQEWANKVIKEVENNVGK